MIKKKGFTLLELIATMVLIAILSAIAIPVFKKVVTKTSDKSTGVTLGVVQERGRYYAAQNGNVFPSDIVAKLAADAFTAPASVQAANSSTNSQISAYYQISDNTMFYAVLSSNKHCLVLHDTLLPGPYVAAVNGPWWAIDTNNTNCSAQKAASGTTTASSTTISNSTFNAPYALSIPN